MPVLRSSTVVELVRGVRAFLTLEAGLTRGQIPDMEQREGRIRHLQGRLAAAERRISRLRKRSSRAEAPGRVNPENIVWVLGSPRTGSTWLARMLRGLQVHVVWDEPFYGVVLGFRENMANSGRAEHTNFILNDAYKAAWLPNLRRLFLDVAGARFPNLTPRHRLIVKEPNGSLSAPLIMDAFPDSKLLFLTRDGRDVVASLLDASRKGDWYPYDNYEASLAAATMQGGRFVFPRHESDDAFVEQLARNYLLGINAVQSAYDRHPEGSKAKVRYEDLRERPFETIRDAYQKMSLDLDEAQLRESVEEQDWEKVPEEQKGEGKFFRKAKIGSWREDLTERQAEIVERVLGEAGGRG